MRGTAKLLNKDFVAATADFQKTIQLNPALEEAYNNYGVLLTRQSKFKEAIKQYDKALSLNKAYTQAYLNRADCKKQLGDLKGAEADQKMANNLSKVNKSN